MSRSAVFVRGAVAFAALGIGALCGCDRPADSVRVLSNASEGRGSADSADEHTAPPAPAASPGTPSGAAAGAAGSPEQEPATTAEGGAPATCPEGRVQPPFDDGAWSVSSLLCAHETLQVQERFVLRAVPGGGNACTCPPNVACAPCVPTRIFRDQPGAELFVVLRAEFPPGLVDGTRADVPVRLLSWGDPPAAVAQLYWER
jgi:hypothetical protein